MLQIGSLGIDLATMILNMENVLIQKKSYKERNYSIDMLRILSMFMIVCLHSMSHGGMYELSDHLGGINLYSVWFHIEESFCILGVNIFVLISGFFLTKENFRISKLYKIIIETLFYSWILILGIYLFKGQESIGGKALVSALLPISYNEYWFVSAYVGIYILSPILNILVRSMTIKQHFGVILLLVGYFSLWNTFIPYSEPMGINRLGQSVSWFSTLYLIAAYIRLYVNKLSRIHVKYVFFISIICMFFSWLILKVVSGMTGVYLGSEITDYWYHYSSLPVLVASVSLFMWFKSININGKHVKKIVKIVAPLCFGVYLIHDNPNMRDVIWGNLRDLRDNTMALPFISLLYAIIVFITCLLIDYIRSLIFRLGNQSKWYQSLLSRMDEKVFIYYDSIFNTIQKYTKFDKKNG